MLEPPRSQRVVRGITGIARLLGVSPHEAVRLIAYEGAPVFILGGVTHAHRQNLRLWNEQRARRLANHAVRKEDAHDG